jgi:hypothetical protein
MMSIKKINASLLVAVLLTVLATGVLLNAYTFTWTSGLYPRLMGWVFLGLTSVELLVQLKEVFAPSAGHGRAVTEATQAPVAKELQAFAWLGGLLLSLYLLGFMVSTPLYVFAFIRFSGRSSLKTSALIAIGISAFVYLVFVRLLAYKLYAGILLG